MLIKLTGINDAMLGTFDAKEVTGTRIDNGEDWGKRFFANNRKLADELSEFGVGDNINVKMVQDGKHWNIAGFSEASEGMVDKVRAGGGGYKNDAKAAPTGGGYKAKAKTGGSNSMSKEEWAEKDRKTKIGMSVHNAVAAASRLCKVGTKPEAVIAYAKELIPFLMTDELDNSKPVKEMKAGADPLDPPAVD